MFGRPQRWLVALVIVIIGFTTAYVPTISAQQRLRKFTFILDFLPYGEYSPYYVALQAGWYKQEGLDVEILRGAGSADTIKRIAVGQGDAGSSDFGSLIAAQANEDVKVKSIAVYFRRPSNSFFVRADSGIMSPKDLRGKTIATTPGNSHQVLWPIVAAKVGIPADSVNWVTMDGSAMGPALIAGKVDAAPFGGQHEARLQRQAREHGVTLRRLAYADYGLEIYSLSLIARDTTINRDAEPLRAFLRGTIRGIRNVCASERNEEQGAGVVVKYNPEVDLDAASGAARVACQYIVNQEVKSGKVAIGQFESGRVEMTRDVVTEFLKLKRKVPAQDLYTNDLLPEKK